MLGKPSSAVPMEQFASRIQSERCNSKASEASQDPVEDEAAFVTVKGQLTGLTPLWNIRMEFAVEALYSLLQAH
jgi:hypothetical protein